MWEKPFKIRHNKHYSPFHVSVRVFRRKREKKELYVAKKSTFGMETKALWN
jgi:hypothetical protein